MKKMLYFLVFILLMSCGFVFAGCKHNKKVVINTRNIPGNVVERIKKDILNDKQDKTIKRAANGVYIIHSGDTTNNTGINFNTITTKDIQIGEVKFDAENFNTKY